MLEANRNKNIKMFTYSEVEKVEGYVGNFTVTIRKKSRYVKETACTGCGGCFDVCPAVTGNEFDQNTGPRRAVYSPFAQAVPNIARIDMDYCIECGLCAQVCEVGAIDYDAKDELIKVNVGVIIVATGWSEYEPPTGHLGYNKYENVITQLKLERALAPNGPLIGHLGRPSDGKRPKSVLFVQCVG